MTSQRGWNRRFDEPIPLPGGGKLFTLRQAIAWLAKEIRRLLGDADRGAHIAPAKLTLQQWAGQWIALKAAERQHKTVARYEDLLRLHVMPKLGDRLLQQIKPHEVNLLYAQMTSLAPRTRYHVATVLKGCLQAAMDSKLIASNPAGGKRPT